MSARVSSRLLRVIAAAPLLWLVVFFLVPFALIVKISFSQSVLALPPYVPVFDLSRGAGHLWARLQEFTIASYAGLANDPIYLEALVTSLQIAACATALTLVIAYPVAYGIARAPEALRTPLVVLAIAPLWTSFLVRVYAWITILKDEGVLNHLLLTLGLIDAPLTIFATNTAVLIGIVYAYLPFMILPLYTAIAKQDPALREAAADLGASPAVIFWRITVPLSWSGIAAGSFLVLVPAIGEFVIPDLLGGSDTLMIGRTIWGEFFDNRDWPTASALAVVLLALVLGPLLLVRRFRSVFGSPAA